MTPTQLAHARHALGLPNSRRCSYRNHFVTGEGGADHAVWTYLVAEGLARRRAGNELSGGGDIFWLTKAGADRTLLESERLDVKDFPQEQAA